MSELIAVAVFVVALALIVSDRFDRTKVALAGAAAMVLAGVLGEESALNAVDLKTLALLAGMMVVVAGAEESGAFEYVALRAVRVSRGHPLGLLAGLAVMTGVLSAFLDNLTAVLLVVPIAFTLAERLGVSPVPFVITEVLASNIGGTATLIGDPPNIMIGAHTGLSFGAFIVNLAPIATVMLLATIGVVHVMFRGQLRIDAERRRSLLDLDVGEPLRRGRHLRRSMAVLAGTIVLFFLHSPLGLGVATVALTGALATMAVSGASADRLLRRVDWATLFFFAGLFVMVHALAEHGTLDRVAEAIAEAAGGDRDTTLVMIMWGAAVGSALVDNIPFTAAMLPVVDQLAQPGDDAYWWALALGACFGGNATLVAAAANVAAAGAAERRGHAIGFWTFTRAGAPVALLSLAAATAYVLLTMS